MACLKGAASGFIEEVTLGTDDQLMDVPNPFPRSYDEIREPVLVTASDLDKSVMINRKSMDHKSWNTPSAHPRGVRGCKV